MISCFMNGVILLYVLYYLSYYLLSNFLKFLGESNSLLIVGPRGSGKTHLVDTCLGKILSKSDEQALVVSHF